MPDENATNELVVQGGDVPAAETSTGTLTKQDIQDVVDSAVSSLAGVDVKSLSDVCAAISSASSPSNSETVAAQLDYINTSIIVNMVLTGAILGALIMRYLLDHFGRRAH